MRGNGIFPETPWDDFGWQDAARQCHRQHAISVFCRLYRQPILNVLRSRRVDVEAEDLTQGFLLHFIKSNAIARVDRSKGRFRDFLSAALNHYLSHHDARNQAGKRGGRAIVLSLDDAGLSETAEFAEADEPKLPCDRAWANSLLESASWKLEMQYASEDRALLFRLLKPYLNGADPLPYWKLALRLRRDQATLRSDVKRLRARFRENLLEELRCRVGPARVEQELEALREILRGSEL